MKKLIVAAAGLLALSVATASAADLGPRLVTKAPPMASVWNWTGFYIGANGGYAWASSTHLDALGRTSGTFNQNGGMIGGTVGYNYQVGGAVLGVETDLDWARINGSAACPFGTCFTNMESFGTFRGRLGYAAGMWMPYITGGLAYADIKVGQSGVVTTNDQWRAGWTVGAGIEAMFAPNWSAKVEYLFADFGNSGGGSYTVPPAVGVTASERNVNVIRAGINYHFGEGPVVARY
jgi:outer membrane immunogenic protein